MPRPLPRRSRRTRPTLRIESLESRHAMAVFLVDSVADSGTGSLRQAIEAANALPGVDRIEFAIQSSSKTIQPQTALPRLTDQVEIDGTTQPGFTNHPLVQLDGSAITQNEAGLLVDADNCVIRGLAINHFAFGILLNASEGAQLTGNYLGISTDGTTQVGNRMHGVYVFDSSNNTIGGSDASDRNVISGNGEFGIRFTGNSTNNRVQGNTIGTDAAGLTAVPNALNGILVSAGASHTIIGTDGDGKDDATEGNIISGNTQSGIRLDESSNNRIAGNRIGIGSGIHTPLGNGQQGIELSSESSLNIIGTNSDGTSDDLEANVISYNKEMGVRINNSRANTVAGNYIGILADGVTASPNVRSGILIDGGSLSNRIGGVSTTVNSAANVISGNGEYGIWLSNSDSTDVFGNLIGRTADNQQMRANTLSAVRIENSNGNAIGAGGTLVNTIGYGQVGIAIVGQSLRNRFDRNTFLGTSGQAIDLSNDGPTANDSLDEDTGPNALQNYPQILLAAGQVLATGMMSARPFTNYDIQLYVTGPTLNDPAITRHEFLVSSSVTTDSNGIGHWLANINATLAPSDAVTAIATAFSSGTSEFSTAVTPVALRNLQLDQATAVESTGKISGTVFRADGDALNDVLVNLFSTDPTRASVPAQVTIPAGQASVKFDVTLLDDAKYHYENVIITATNTDGSGAIELTITDNDNPWHNYARTMDVSGDGRITALDALLIINQINSGQTGSLASRTLTLPPQYFDTNDDNNLTSIDALLVINALNSGQGSEGEGEGEGVELDSDLYDAVDLELLLRARRGW